LAIVRAKTKTTPFWPKPKQQILIKFALALSFKQIYNVGVATAKRRPTGSMGRGPKLKATLIANPHRPHS